MSVPDHANSFFDAPADNDDLCEEGGPRACDQLLTDPVGAMLDPSRRPNHVCGDVLLTLVGRWKSYRYFQVFGTDAPGHGTAWDLDPLNYDHLFPEVGRSTLREWIRGYRVFEERDLGIAVQEEPATLITPVLARVGQARVVFLGLGTWPEGRGAMSRADDGSVVGFSLPVAREAFLQVEGAHLDKEVVRVVNALQQWWASVSGTTLTGRDTEKRGPDPFPIDWDMVTSAALRLNTKLRESARWTGQPEKPASDEQVYEAVKIVLGMELSTFRNRLAKARKEGLAPKPWPSGLGGEN